VSFLLLNHHEAQRSGFGMEKQNNIVGR